jgi:hypothetical protein
MIKKISFPVVFLSILSACDLSSAQICYPDEDNLNLLISELEKQKISYEKGTENGCIFVKGLTDKKYEEIREKLFGSSPPQGLSISWPIEAYGVVDGVKFKLDETKRILDRLKEENIEFTFMTYFDQEYLVWNKKDDVLVRKILKNQI